MIDFVLLPVFLIFNFFALRWLSRRLVVRSEWLWDPDRRAEVLKEYGLDELRELLIPFLGGRSYSWNNPLVLLLTLLGTIASVLWGDYLVIRERWPWLLGG